MKKDQFYGLVVSIIGMQLIGVFGSFFVTKDALLWYESLEKSPYTPPHWVFSWVWIFLYALLSFVGYSCYQQRKKMGLWWYLFIVHIVANATWTYSFFGLKNITLSTMQLAFIMITLVLVMRWLYIHDRRLFLYLIPYGLWLCYASYLQWYIWWYHIA